MKNLQSKQMPFRTNDRFYQSAFKEKSAQSIRVFPQKQTDTKQLLSPVKQTSPSVLKYLSGLSQAKHLPRRAANKEQFYPLVKICRRHRVKNFKIQNFDQGPQNIEIQMPKEARFQTFSSVNPSDRSIIVHSFVNEEEKRIDRDKQEFRKTRSLKGSKTKQMNFSFYNTLQKSQFLLKRFKQDTFMAERRTNKYQNIVKRAITSENIFHLLNKSRQKLKLGILQ